MPSWSYAGTVSVPLEVQPITMNPLAELAQLISELCIFLVMRMAEGLAVMIFCMNWTFVPRLLELYQFNKFHNEDNLPRTSRGQDYSNSRREHREADSPWYLYFSFHAGFLSEYLGTCFIENFLYILCGLPSWFGFLTPYSAVVLLYCTKVIFNFSFNVENCAITFHGHNSEYIEID